MTKKICPNSSHPHDGIVMDYTYPVYHDKGKKHYVDFKAYDPATGVMRRKKFHLDYIAKKSERKVYANKLISELAYRLSTGWNPWVDTKTYRGYTELNEVFDRYLENIAITSRQKTVHSYTSRVNVFREFLSSLSIEVKYVYQYNTQLIIDFLDWLLIDRRVVPRTRNNYKGWCNAFGEYLVSRKYIEKNPCEGIAKITEKPKKRKALSEGMLRQLSGYLMEHDKYFLLAVMMQYYTLIRPGELTNIRLRDFSIKKQSVFISGEISKNKRDGYVGVNETIINLMLDLGIFSHPGECYLFSKNFRPGMRKMGPDIFNKRWHSVRKIMKWDDCYQFYSLKDTGIRDLANEMGIVVARDQARHTDVATTNKYLGRNDTVWNETKVFRGGLSAIPDDKTPL